MVDLDFTKLKVPVKKHDNCVVIDVSSGAFPRYIEVRMPGKDGARRTALWDGLHNLSNNNKVMCEEYPGNPVLRIVGFGGDQDAQSTTIWTRTGTEIDPTNDGDSLALYDDAATERLELNPGTSSTEAFWEIRDQTGALKLRLSTDNLYRFLVSSGGVDTNQNIFQVDVTGSPTLIWDETNDRFKWNKGAEHTAGDIIIAAGGDLKVTGAAAPQSQAQRAILDRLGHSLDHGHSLNVYPASPDADDAEFNNATQADNNTIGTHAGGDFWEWSSGDPSAGSGNYNIDTQRESHLFVNVHRLDSDAFLQANVSAITVSTAISFDCLIRFIYPFSTSSDEYFAIRVTDASESNYFEIFWRNDGATPAMEVGTAFVDGGARTEESGPVVFADQPGPEAMWIRWQQQANDKYRGQFSLDGFNFFNLKAGAYTFSNTYAPDQLELVFGKPDTASINVITYYVDSFRRS